MMRAEAILGMPARAERWGAIVTIQPEQAKRLLECQPTQRPVDDRHVALLRAEIEAGRFTLTHQGIAFDETGLLFDGQHRLWACFLSGHAISAWVFFNEPRSNFDVVDTRSKARSNGQLAVVKGQFSNLAHADAASAAGRFLHTYDLGLNPTLPYTHITFMSREMDAVLAAHPGLPAMVQQFRDRQAARRLRLPSAPCIALFTMFAEASPAKAAIFLHQVLTGENLKNGDPALTLRNSAASSAPTQRGRAVDVTYRIARAWNHFYAGRTVLKLYGSDAANGTKASKGGRDVFPEVAGYTRPIAR